MIDGDVAPPEILRRLVPLADYAVFSDAGLLACTEKNDVSAALRAVAATHPGHVGASCGPEGYFWVEGDAIRHVPAPPIAASAPKRQLIAPPQPRPAQVLSGCRTLIRALGASGGTRQRRPSAVVSAR
jgi:hypothetical protein